MKINSANDAIQVFIKAAIEHTKATEKGDYKLANNNFDLIVSSAKYLKSNNLISGLRELFDHDNLGVRIWAATYSLGEFEKDAKELLHMISKLNAPQHSFTAGITLEEWNSGNLKLQY